MKKLLLTSLFLLVFTLVAYSSKQAEAATYPSGSLLAFEGVEAAAVYYIGDDGKKYIFPDSNTYFTWYKNFNDVKKVPVSVLDEYHDGGTVPYRGGASLITHKDTNRIYAVEPGGIIRWLKTAEIAENLYGANWGNLVKDVIPGFFSVSYTTGTELTDKLPTGTIVKEVGGDDYYYIKNGLRKKLSANALEVNHIDVDHVIELDDLTDYLEDLDIESEENELLEVHYRYKHRYHEGEYVGETEEGVVEEEEEVEIENVIKNLEATLNSSTKLGVYSSTLTMTIDNQNDSTVSLSSIAIDISNVRITSLCDATTLEISTTDELVYSSGITSEGYKQLLLDTTLDISAYEDAVVTFELSDYCGLGSNARIDLEVSNLKSDTDEINTTGLPINVQFKRTDN
jgi:hypothetical protein